MKGLLRTVRKALFPRSFLCLTYSIWFVETLILACDGLWDVLSNEEAVNLMNDVVNEGERSVLLMAEELIDNAFCKGTLHFLLSFIALIRYRISCACIGSKDNISAMVIRLAELPPPLPSKGGAGGVKQRRLRRTGEQELSSLYVDSSPYCLNANPLFPFTNLNSGEEGQCLRSDSDAQILIHVVFQTSVKISSLMLKSLGDDDELSIPKRVKLFVNLTHPNFSDIDGTTPRSIFIR